ncbi:MAG TPA: Ldh family oxidoreductase [Candidatus Saccharimonadales bacterium]|nr:Ldh family oxidoreductase [Candidatus Saccharimonadales bacterium]
MPALAASSATDLVVCLLAAYGVPRSQAQSVANHLIEADLSGVPSHGILRLPQYVAQLGTGELVADAQPVVRGGGSECIDVDGFRCFGQVACETAVRELVKSMKHRTLGLATVKNAGHSGRLGAYAEALGREGLLSMLFCSGPKRLRHYVAPFNGREGRLATNPIAFSIPTGGQPIVGDFSTSATPEGRIRRLAHLDEPAPDDSIIDARGDVTSDPHALYASPPGAILPFGGEHQGHRGYALGLLVEAFATLLPGELTTDATRVGNNVAMIAVSPDVGFTDRANDLAAYILSTPPRRAEVSVLLPGALEYARRQEDDEIVIDDVTWEALVRLAQARGVPVT